MFMESVPERGRGEDWFGNYFPNPKLWHGKEYTGPIFAFLDGRSIQRRAGGEREGTSLCGITSLGIQTLNNMMAYSAKHVNFKQMRGDVLDVERELASFQASLAVDTPGAPHPEAQATRPCPHIQSSDVPSLIATQLPNPWSLLHPLPNFSPNLYKTPTGDLLASFTPIMSKMWEVDPETRSKVRGERRDGI
jgi:hypothetical protein